MKELKRDIFSFIGEADAICFTANGIVKANGELVMGAGVAKAFADRWPPITVRAGHCVKTGGNRVHWLKDVPAGGDKYVALVSFPTKHHWKDLSDLRLIRKSAEELVSLTNAMGWKLVALPFPGIGLGGQSEEVVRKVIAPILDDRFVVLTK